jgi:hypothetical protein
MAERVAGIAFLTVDGNQLALRGNFTVSPSAVERTMIAGQDGVHGYQELPRVPYIEADITLMPGMSLEALEAETNSTVVAQLANSMQYTLISSTCKAGFEANTRDGQTRVRWEGLSCQELSLGTPIAFATF